MKSTDWFFGKSQQDPNGGCWLWGGYLMKTGYGVYMEDRARWLAHRGSWVAANGRPVPAGMMVCHKCDVRACVNPDHLWIGTAQDNFDDAKRKSRLAWQVSSDWAAGKRIRRGEGHPQAKLTDADVLAICALDGVLKQEEIGALYGVSGSHISEVLNGKSRGEVLGRPVSTRHRNNALTVQQIEMAKRLKVEGLTNKAIGASLGVSQTTILRAARGFR